MDMKEANKAIARERHLISTLDEVAHDLNGTRAFSKLDLNHGFQQLVMQPFHSSCSVQIQAFKLWIKFCS